MAKGGTYFGNHYQSAIASDSGDSKIKMMRLAQEASAISTSLPLSYSSSVFVLIDEARMDVWRALIIGPEGTPYENGCFQFDIFFPASYPKSPPLVNLQTTGGSRVRFNPNLYECGKVCLSLLGTWDGAADEMWSERTSTFLQVLVSIQSLILVPEPYFNEPGFESSRGTRDGDRENARYNAHIHSETINVAILEQLKKPAEGFEDIIRTHCFIKRKEIMATARRWRSGMGGHDTTGYATTLDTALTALTEMFAAMPIPAPIANTLTSEEIAVLTGDYP
eukprot:c18371_g1_i1.p2 GENE.c18371_g1_i1~~c18371_g1_i1.p2  ORF type:complete len:308 (+),score=74.53 c18371_g1_i1:89-925(+)